MVAPTITRLDAYGVCPDTTTPQRYVGTDMPFRLSAEILRITLSNGAQGVASTCSGWRGAPVGRIVTEAEQRACAMIGLDAASARRTARATAPASAHPHGPDVFAALLDTALWDAHARSLGQSLHRMLGARRNTLPAYASTPAYLDHESYLVDVETALGLGCGAVKFHFNGDVDFDVELVERVAAEFGNTPLRFAADLEGVYSRDDAAAMAELLGAHRYLWMEAPFPDDRIEDYSALRDRSPVELVAPGYDRVGRLHWREGLSRGAWSRLRFDVSLTGITDAVEGSALASQYGCPLELQSFGYMPAQAANFAVMLASPKCEWFELPLPIADFGFACTQGIEISAAGEAVWPAGAGLGTSMDFDLIAEVAMRRFSI